MRGLPATGWVAAGAAQCGLGLLLALLAAAPSGLLPPSTHVLVLASGLLILAAGLAMPLLPAFVGREPAAPWLPLATLATFALADALLLAAPFAGIAPAATLAPLGLAILLLCATGLSTLVGPRGATDVRLFDEGQPFARGDRVALAGFLLALAGGLATGLLFLVPPRGVALPGLAALLLGTLPPLLVGLLAFLLPRRARHPLEGATLVGTAYGVLVAATAAFVVALSFPGALGLREPAAGVFLAYALVCVAFARGSLEGADQPDAAPAATWLRTALALAALAGLALFLAVFSGVPGDLAGAALYAHLALFGALVVALLVLAAPLTFPGRARPGAWAKWSGALLVAGLFLLAPSFQYERSAFPGAVVLALAALLAVRGLAPVFRGKERGNRAARRAGTR